MRRIFGIFLTLVAFLSAAAQEEFSILVMNGSNNTFINDAYVIAMKDSVAHYANSGSEGTARFTNLTPGRWIFRASHKGFAPDTVSAEVGGERNAAVIRLKPATELEEVVVQGDKSKIVTHMHDGERFYLSPRALKLPDPYQALAEIPMLKTDVMKGQLYLTDGISPKIMINGEERSYGGLENIKPSDIEAVEVITLPDMSYVMSGVKAIVNIKVKQKEGAYLALNARTNNQVPFHNGNSEASMEVGNLKFTYYTRADIGANYHVRARNQIWRENTDYSQNFTKLRKHNDWQWNWFNRMNWAITGNDKLAVSLMLHGFKLKAHEESTGESTKSGVATPYNSVSDNRNSSRMVTASAYYTHTFSSSGKLEASAVLTHNNYTTAEEREEQLFGQASDADVSLLSAGNYLFGELKYTGNVSWGSFTGGVSNISSWDNVNDRIGVNPKFLYHTRFSVAYFTWNKYFGSWSLSAGAAGQWIHLSDSYSAARKLYPWATVSANWNASSKSSWRLTYYHSNGMPSLQNSNPYTTSTDPLYANYGNPELKALSTDDVTLNYMLNSGNWYLSSSLTARYTRDAVRSFGYTEGDRYIVTLINSNVFSLTPSLNLNRRFSWGSAYADFSLPVTKWSGLHRLTNASLMAGVNGSFGKFYVSADCMLTIRSEGVYQKQTATRPWINLDAVYNATPNFSIGVSLSHLAGNFKSTTKYDDGSFRYTDTRTLLKSGFQPSIMLSWKLMRNQKQRMQFDPNLKSGRTSYSL